MDIYICLQWLSYCFKSSVIYSASVHSLYFQHFRLGDSILSTFNMHFTTAALTAVGLLGVKVAAQSLGQTAICPFDGNRGPNVLLAVVQ